MSCMSTLTWYNQADIKSNGNALVGITRSKVIVSLHDCITWAFLAEWARRVLFRQSANPYVLMDLRCWKLWVYPRQFLKYRFLGEFFVIWDIWYVCPLTNIMISVGLYLTDWHWECKMQAFPLEHRRVYAHVPCAESASGRQCFCKHPLYGFRQKGGKHLASWIENSSAKIGCVGLESRCNRAVCKFGPLPVWIYVSYVRI